MSNSIQSYKGRKVNPHKPVKVYRCLNRNGVVFSIQQEGKVVGHTSNLFLKDVTLKINNSGKKKAIESKIRNVHAFVVGMISEEEYQPQQRITYNPFVEKGFYFQESGEEVSKLDKAQFNTNGFWSCKQ